MLRFSRKLEEEREYYEMKLAQSEQKQVANLVFGLALGAIAGYCAKKYVMPKLAEGEYKAKLAAETELLKERFGELKHSVLSLKDKIQFGCCDDDCCCCDDDCECECEGCNCEDDDCCSEDCCCGENCAEEDRCQYCKDKEAKEQSESSDEEMKTQEEQPVY